MYLCTQKPQNERVMRYENQDRERYQALVRLAAEHVAGSGERPSIRTLLDAFNDYFKWHEESVEAGYLESFGGMSGGTHNRTVLTLRIARDAKFHCGIDGELLDALYKSLDLVDGNTTGERMVYTPWKPEKKKKAIAYGEEA